MLSLGSSQNRKKWFVGLVFIGAFSLFVPYVRAVILFGTDDPAANTTAPTGSLAGSGWQWTGSWGSFLGTAISPNYFLTVQHIGGRILDVYRYRGVEYRAIKFFDDTESDLRLVQVAGILPDFAPLQARPDEFGAEVVVMGRGTRRGSPVMAPTGTSFAPKGWKWGEDDAVQRWGRNRVSALIRNGATDFLVMKFDANEGPDEAHLSRGDSGGPLFIQDGILWRLAGVNFASEGEYSFSSIGPGFLAAVFDEGGLYKGPGPSWQRVNDLFFDLPGRFFSIRISSRLNWIRSVTGALVPVPATPPTVQSSFLPEGPYTDRSDAIFSDSAKLITLPAGSFSEFFRLKSAVPARISAVQARNGSVILAYE